MDHMYDDYFPEPREHEEEVTALIGAIRGAVKADIQNELDKLRKENAKLQEIKTRMQDIDREHRRKISELEQAKSTVLQDVRRERLHTLMKNLGHEIFGITYNYVYGEKCDKCDKNRYVHFKSPSDKDMYEECECKTNNRAMVFKPVSHVTCAVDLERGGTVFYKPYDHKENYFVEDSSSNVRNIAKDDETFEEIKSSAGWYSNVSFKTEVRALEFCAWLNDQKLREW
jgi:hypothetical protein